MRRAMSDDPADDHSVDEFAESLATDLSRINGSLVIAIGWAARR